MSLRDDIKKRFGVGVTKAQNYKNKAMAELGITNKIPTPGQRSLIFNYIDNKYGGKEETKPNQETETAAEQSLLEVCGDEPADVGLQSDDASIEAGVNDVRTEVDVNDTPVDINPDGTVPDTAVLADAEPVNMEEAIPTGAAGDSITMTGAKAPKAKADKAAPKKVAKKVVVKKAPAAATAPVESIVPPIHAPPSM